MKPVNCPHHTQIYASRPRSYRDLPIRYMETTMQYRDEKPGEIGGLTRVRAITVDDGHIFCTVEQIKQEAINIAKIIEEFYTSLGMYGNHWVSLSVRDPQHLEKYIGDEKDWQTAEKMLQDVSEELGLNAKRMEGEAALYGPKLDFMFKDTLGNERQLSTIQLDFATAKRFDLSYTESDGSETSPVIIHRAILGSYERFLAILIEHFAGSFPVWLAPVQLAILPVSEKHLERAKQVEDEFLKHDIRAELDTDNKTLGAKIRTATLQKVPYMVIIGDKEVSEGDLVVTVRTREGHDEGLQTVSDFLKTLKQRIET
jgi:threonyl-tRNA synthetase